jgi:hypothetical protein
MPLLRHPGGEVGRVNWSERGTWRDSRWRIGNTWHILRLGHFDSDVYAYNGDDIVYLLVGLDCNQRTPRRRERAEGQHGLASTPVRAVQNFKY